MRFSALTVQGRMHASQHCSSACLGNAQSGQLYLRLLYCRQCLCSSSACSLCIAQACGQRIAKLQSHVEVLSGMLWVEVGGCLRVQGSSRAAAARQGALLQLLRGALLVLGDVGGEGAPQQSQRGGQPEQGDLVQPAPQPLQARLLPGDPQSYALSKRGCCQTKDRAAAPVYLRTARQQQQMQPMVPEMNTLATLQALQPQGCWQDAPGRQLCSFQEDQSSSGRARERAVTCGRRAAEARHTPGPRTAARSPSPAAHPAAPW